jgi:hypothetical protein
MALTMGPSTGTDPAQDDIKLASLALFGLGDSQSIWRHLQAEDAVDLAKPRLKHFWSATRHEEAKFVLENGNRTFSIQRSGANSPMGPEFEDAQSPLFAELSQSGQQLAVMARQPHDALRRLPIRVNGRGRSREPVPA